MSRSTFKYVLLLMLAPASLSFAAGDTAQVKKRPENPQYIRHTIKSNPLALTWGPIPFTSELRYVQEVPVAPYQSTQIGFSLLGKSFVLGLTEKGAYQNPHQPRITVRGFRMQISHRIFYRKDDYAPHGAYIGPLISYSSAKFSTRYLSMFDNYIRVTHYNFNIVGGYQTIADNIVIDMFAGIGYKKNRIEKHLYNQATIINIDDLPFYNSPVKLIFGFNVGLAF